MGAQSCWGPSERRLGAPLSNAHQGAGSSAMFPAAPSSLLRATPGCVPQGDPGCGEGASPETGEVASGGSTGPPGVAEGRGGAPGTQASSHLLTRSGSPVSPTPGPLCWSDLRPGPSRLLAPRDGPAVALSHADLHLRPWPHPASGPGLGAGFVPSFPRLLLGRTGALSPGRTFHSRMPCDAWSLPRGCEVVPDLPSER